MEAEISSGTQMDGILHRLLPAVVPVVLISIGYVDPGKWAATIEGGARFGFDLAMFLLLFNFAAILCQYLSARVGVVTGRDLARICSDEYDKWTCMFLGVQAEVSVIALDLTMILGISHGLNIIFGLNLFACVLLTAVDVFLFPLVAAFVENYKVKSLSICVAGLIFFFYVLGVLISQPEIPVVMNGMLTKLNGESAFVLMSLLGANIMPHNFYLHSSIVQKNQRSVGVSKETLCQDHFFAILCVLGGASLVNYALLNSAANLFYSTGLVLLTLQDAMSLMDQVFRSPMAPFAFLLVLLFSSQITALTWNLGGPDILQEFFGLGLPNSTHRATIRVFTIIPALYCIWNSGAEGIYQLLIFTQIITALLLPSSVIPLFRVASSRPIMGAYKISVFMEFLALIIFIGMLGLNIVFVVELIFGNSDWVSNLRWNMESTAVLYVVLLITSCVSFCFMLWLAATPLKSASIGLDAQMWDLPDSYTEREVDVTESIQTLTLEPTPALEKSLENRAEKPTSEFDFDLPETIVDYHSEPHLSTIDENSSNITFSSSSLIHDQEEVTSTVELVLESVVVTEVSDSELQDSNSLKSESVVDPVEKTVGVEGDTQTEKDDDEVDSWEPEEPSKEAPESGPPSTSDGPGSFRSYSGKGDDGGNGPGSLSRLSGLGRAARRQLAAFLDEFWGQLYDFHGQATQEAKAKKMDILLTMDSRFPISSLKMEPTGKEFTEFTDYYPTVGMNSSLYDSPKQQRLPSGTESSASLYPNRMQLLDAYVQNSSRNTLDSSEKRYYSLRAPPSSEAWDYQPATVHGYQIASYLSRIAKDRSSDDLSNQMEPPPSKFSSLGPTNYKEPLPYTMAQKPQNGLSSSPAPGFQNVVISRKNPLQAERPYYGFSTSVSTETKKYHSLPDISGISVPLRDSYLSDRNAKWDGPIGFGLSVGKTGYGQPMYPNTGSRAVAPLAFDDLSPSNAYTDAFSLQLNPSSETGSLWSRQPFEQFGVASNSRLVPSLPRETTSVLDLESKLLQSFRFCIVKLLKLEGSEWLFRQNDGADEDLIDRVAAREKLLYEAETREMNLGTHLGETPYSPDRKSGSLKGDEAAFTKFLVSSIPHCGEGCVWRVDLIVSFGVWSIHRILELSLMESRPELWGKYTYVLNRLQGIIDLAFSKPRNPMSPCFCLQLPAAHQKRASPPISNGILPSAVKVGRGKCTTAAMLLDVIKDVEIAISCRKGRTGTAAGDVAFPKGKENLASVLKRYKRRLSNKPVGPHEPTSGPRKYPTSTPYGP